MSLLLSKILVFKYTSQSYFKVFLFDSYRLSFDSTYYLQLHYVRILGMKEGRKLHHEKFIFYFTVFEWQSTSNNKRLQSAGDND